MKYTKIPEKTIEQLKPSDIPRGLDSDDFIIQDKIEELRLLPEMIKSLEKTLQNNNAQATIWLLLIKDVIAQQAKSFDTLSVFYACNPQVSKTYRECAAALRTPEEHEATEEEYQEKLKQTMKQMGVSFK